MSKLRKTRQEIILVVRCSFSIHSERDLVLLFNTWSENSVGLRWLRFCRRLMELHVVRSNYIRGKKLR